MQVYTFKTDTWMGSLRRVVDNINSNLYEMKETQIDYFAAIMEDNNTTVDFYAANITFDILFHLIITLIKRLYIYSTVSQDSKKYAALVREAEAKYRTKMNLQRIAR